MRNLKKVTLSWWKKVNVDDGSKKKLLFFFFSIWKRQRNLSSTAQPKIGTREQDNNNRLGLLSVVENVTHIMESGSLMRD